MLPEVRTLLELSVTVTVSLYCPWGQAAGILPVNTIGLRVTLAWLEKPSEVPSQLSASAPPLRCVTLVLYLIEVFLCKSISLMVTSIAVLASSLLAESPICMLGVALGLVTTEKSAVAEPTLLLL